MIRFTKTIVVL